MKLARSMVRCLPLLFLVACGTVREWRYLDTEPMSLAECYDGVVFIAEGGRFYNDKSVSDRGLGTYQSRWLRRESERNFPLRLRLRCEVLIDQGSSEKGWPVRYVVEQEKVEDLRRHRDPQEEDWEADGQDSEAESMFGNRLARRLAPKSVVNEPPPRR